MRRLVNQPRAYNKAYEHPISVEQAAKESRKALKMYRDAMDSDIPKTLGDRLPRKEEEKEEPVQRRISEYVVEVNGKYRTVEYPVPQ